MKLRSRHLIPPSLCSFVDDQMQRVVVAGNFDDLVQRVSDLRRINKMKPVKQLADIVERQIAERAPEQLTILEDGEARKVQLDMRAPSVQMRTEKLKNAARNAGGLLCDDERAHQRAKTCLACPKHMPIDCLSCSGVLEWMLMVQGISEWPDLDKKLQGCSCLGWYVKVMTNIRIKTFLEMGLGMKKIETLPDCCWLKTETIGVDHE